MYLVHPILFHFCAQWVSMQYCNLYPLGIACLPYLFLPGVTKFGFYLLLCDALEG